MKMGNFANMQRCIGLVQRKYAVIVKFARLSVFCMNQCLFDQLPVFEEEIPDHFIRERREEFIHEDGTFTREG
jgi:hypothetical protein